MLGLTLPSLDLDLADQAGEEHHRVIVEVVTDQDQGPEIGDEDHDLVIGDEDLDLDLTTGDEDKCSKK